MLYDYFQQRFTDNIILVIAAGLGFALTFVLLMKPAAFLPKDGGKFILDPDGNRHEVNQSSSGKVTGAGLVFVLVYLLMSVLFIQTSRELLNYIGLSIIMMITGYLDDTSKSSWGELIKGILDLIVAVITAVTFVVHNSSDVLFLGFQLHIPKALYVILAVMLIWASINVTNCSDGVDGLSGTVSVIIFVSMSIIFKSSLGAYSWLGIIFSFVLLAYLAYNWYPSTVLMGDAGSRTIGFTIALLCMKTGHPFSFLLFGLVFIFDGGLGLLKLAIMRVTKKPFLEKIRFPFHDELRKNRNWSVPKIVTFFCICEVIFCVIEGLLIKLL